MDVYKQFYDQSEEYFAQKKCSHTAREIAHQPQMWRGLCGVLQENQQKIKDFMASIGPLNGVRIVLTGAGSSGFIGAGVAGFAAQSAGIHCEAIHTTDIVSAPETALFPDMPTVLISFARSGNSPESEGAVRAARKLIKNLYEVAIVCDGGSRLSKVTQESEKGLLLVMPEGTNDKGFAMTSSVSCMMLAGFALLNPCKIEEIITDIKTLAGQVEKDSLKLSKAAADCAGWDFARAWYLGSGPLAAITREGALKLMELTNGAVVAGQNGAAEFRHGPKTVMNPQTITIHFISGNAFTAQYDKDLLNELSRERDGNKIIALYNESEDRPPADLSVPYSAAGYGICREIAVGIQGLVFMQVLSMYKSLALGVPTDNPSPSGLVNRVVQGVTVYPV